jgi:hypothetical protein
VQPSVIQESTSKSILIASMVKLGFKMKQRILETVGRGKFGLRITNK